MKLTIKETSLFKFAKEEDSADKKSLEPEFTIEGATLKNCKTNGCKVIKIPAKVTVIGDYAFYRSDVEEVILPNSLKTIGEAAFYQCSSLKKINFPEKLERIKHSAFKSCIALESVDFPKEMLYIESSAFENSGLKHVTLPEKMIHHDKNGENIFAETALKTVNIPKNFSLETGMFADCHQLKSVKLSCGKSVSKNCFAGCENLEDISLDSIGWFGDGAFKRCKSLKTKELTLYPYQHVRSDAFVECSFEKVHIENVDGLGTGVFKKCNLLKEVTINAPKADSLINMGIFEGCSNLETVTFTDEADTNIVSISEYAFYGCEKLTGIKLPKNLKRIASFAFQYTGLSSITFPESLKSINEGAFSYTDFEEINIPDSVEFLDQGVFNGCVKLKKAHLSKRLTTIQTSCFTECKELCEITGIENVRAINCRAFARCRSLKEFDFSNINSIGKSAFECSGLEKIECSSRLMNLGKQAFAGCINLKRVDLSRCMDLGKIPEECFNDIDNELDLRLPAKALTFERRCLHGLKLDHLTIYPGSYLIEFALYGVEAQTLEFLPVKDENCIQTRLYTGRELAGTKVHELIVPDYMYDKYKEIWDKME